MSARAGSKRSRRRLSAAFALIGAVLALVGGLLLYARENLFDADALADRAEAALSDERVRLAIAQPITTTIVDSGPSALVNARPLIESVVTGALGTPPVKAAFGEAVKALNAKLFQRDPETLLLNLADVASIAAGTIEAVSPKLSERVPEDLDPAKLELIEGDVAIRALDVAEKVRFLGLVLPPVAVLMLFGSVAVAPDRRRGLVRASLGAAAAAVAGLVLLAVARALVTSQFDDELVRDAVSGIWEALFGDLRSAFLFAAILAIVLAAAARFSTEDELDPLAPLARAGDWLRSRPERASVALLRGLALAAGGVALVLRPELSVEAFAVVAGAWLLYVGVGDLLAILAPRVEATSGEPRRKLRPGRVMAVGLIAATALVAVLVLPAGEDAPARPPGPPLACNGYPELCPKRLDELTFPATHNSMSAAEEPGWFVPNQRYGIIRQLDDGIRALLIDTHYGVRRGSGRGFAEVITDLGKESKTREEVVAELGDSTVQKAEDLVGKLAFDGVRGDPEPYLCHVLCELGATELDTALTGIEDWMSRHPDEFLIIFIEDVVSPEETAKAFEPSGLLRFAYEPDRSLPSPPLGELIESDKRLLVMAENDAGGGKFPWYQQGFDLVQETPYTFSSVAEIESPVGCRPNRGGPANPLFLINNWIEKIPRDPDLAERINSQEALLDRARLCGRIRGLEPNLLAVDYHDRGDVVGVANVLNGVPADAPAEVRTLP